MPISSLARLPGCPNFVSVAESNPFPSIPVAGRDASETMLGGVCVRVVTAWAATIGLMSEAGGAEYPGAQYSGVETLSLTIPGLNAAADVYLPTGEASRGEPLTLAVFLQGFCVEKANYSRFAAIVAQHGFVVVVPNCPVRVGQFTLFMPYESNIESVVRRVSEEAIAHGSPLFGRVDPCNIVLLGHSLGAGVGFGAVCGSDGAANERSYTIRAGAFVAPFTPATTRQLPRKPIGPLSTLGIPVLLLHGTLDGVNDPELTVAAYESLQDRPKALVMVEGSNHYGMTNEDNPPGAPRDVNSPALDQTAAIEAYACWTGQWLRSTVAGDPEAMRFIAVTGDEMDEAVQCFADLSVGAPAAVPSGSIEDDIPKRNDQLIPIRVTVRPDDSGRY